MKTPAISNLTSLGSGSAAPAKAPGASSENQFNQMLSREMADRRSVNEPGKPIAKDSRPADQVAQTAKPAAESNESNFAETDKTAAAAKANTASVADAAPAAAGRGKAKASSDAGPEDEEAALAAGSDQLLALVANLNQNAALPTEPAKDTQPADSMKQPADTAPVITAAQAGTAVATVAAAATATAAPTTSAAVSAAVDTARAIGKDGARPGIAESGKQSATVATNAGVPGETKEFGVSSAPAGDTKPAPDVSTAHEFSLKELADPAQSAPELRAAKAVHDAPPAAVQAAPFQLAAQQQAPLQQVQQAAAAAAADKLAPRVGSSGWDQALGQKVVWMVAGEQQSASLTLNPPDLGPLQVVLNVTNSHATVNFTAAQPEVRQALESAVPKLREMLGDAGIQLGQANVSAGTPNHQQGGFGERQQAARGAGPMVDDAAGAPVRVGRSQVITGTGGQGLVDTFA